jgi:DNA-binding NarL/FixJ family response regulator
LATSTVRVLVVDDFEPFRQLICLMLQKVPEVQIIFEVSDGLQAVQKAQELKPDLVVLDLGLPKLNGIEAARQIRELVPKSRIIFLSQESCVEVVREALRAGGLGYIVKSDAGDELLAAVKAVLRGERFLGARFAGHDFT